jgi:hypothetical protein
VGLLATELAAYPLWAAVGVGAGTLLAAGRLRRQRSGAFALTTLLRWTTALAGMVQDDSPWIPIWLLGLLPPLAAGTAITQSGPSLDANAELRVIAGDWETSQVSLGSVA